MQSLCLKRRQIANEVRKPLSIRARKVIDQGSTALGQLSQHHSTVLGMSATRDPTLTREDVDVERRRAPRNREASRELRWRETHWPGFTELEQGEECSRRESEIGERIRRGAVERPGRPEQLRYGGKARGFIRLRLVHLRNDNTFGRQPARMNRDALRSMSRWGKQCVRASNAFHVSTHLSASTFRSSGRNGQMAILRDVVERLSVGGRPIRMLIGGGQDVRQEERGIRARISVILLTGGRENPYRLRWAL
jgi:hypothetical protein